jgi:hypothetical protein
MIFMTHEQTAVFAQAMVRSTFKHFAVAAQRLANLGRWAAAAVGRLDRCAARPPSRARSLSNSRSAVSRAGGWGSNIRGDEGDFRPGGRTGEVASRRNTFAIDHHHPFVP